MRVDEWVGGKKFEKGMSRLSLLDALQISFEEPAGNRSKSSPLIKPGQKPKNVSFLREKLKPYNQDISHREPRVLQKI